MQIIKLTLAIILFWGCNQLFAQPCPPGPDGLPDCSGGDPSVPLDGGVSLILAAGVGIAAKKMFNSRK